MNTLNKGLLYIVFFILFLTRFIYTCNGENKLIKVTFVYNAYDWFIDYNLRDTYDTPSIFLNNPRSDLKFFDIEEESFLFEIEQVLDKSEPDSADYLLSFFNTDFVLFFQQAMGTG